MLGSAKALNSRALPLGSRKQGGLLAGFALEANIRLDDELGARSLESRCQGLPLVQMQQGTEVSYGNAMAINPCVAAGDS